MPDSCRFYCIHKSPVQEKISQDSVPHGPRPIERIDKLQTTRTLNVNVVNAHTMRELHALFFSLLFPLWLLFDVQFLPSSLTRSYECRQVVMSKKYTQTPLTVCISRLLEFTLQLRSSVALPQMSGGPKVAGKGKYTPVPWPNMGTISSPILHRGLPPAATPGHGRDHHLALETGTRKVYPLSITGDSRPDHLTDLTAGNIFLMSNVDRIQIYPKICQAFWASKSSPA